MTDTARAQLGRILDLIPRLADDRRHAIATVARQAGTSREQLLRDLRALAERDQDPAGFVEGVEVYIDGESVLLHSQHFLRPMRLTLAELAALELGLAMLERERPPEEIAPIRSARERLRMVITRLPADSAPLREGAAAATVDPAVLALLRRAAQSRHKVRIDYQSGNAKGPGRRIACPYGLVATRGMWYLVAHCEKGEGLRFFRADRISKVELQDDRFSLPADFSIDAVLQDGVAFRAEQAAVLTVRYSARIARWIAERAGVPVAADGSLTMEHPLADTGWAARHVLQYGPDAEVIAPPEARAEVLRRLTEILAG
jgi:predicted DNA-binding transcriptional regulator YafY